MTAPRPGARMPWRPMLRGSAAAAALCAMVGVTPASAQELPSCPDRVTVAETWQGGTPDGWEVMQRESGRHLVDIRFHAGPPASAPMIDPIAGNSRGHMFSLRYQFDPAAGEVWMSCIYMDTAHALVRRLPGPFPPHVRVNHDRRERRVFITYF